MLSLGIICALVAMSCWGIADFLQATAIKKIGSMKSMFFGNMLGFIAALPIMIYVVITGQVSIGLLPLGILAFGSIFDTLGVYFFARSFDHGEVSVVAPISASYSLVTVILSVLILGDILRPITAWSIAIIIVGIVLTSTDINKLKNLHTVKGVKDAILSLLFWGIYFFIIGYARKFSMGFLTLFFYSTIFNSIFMVGFAALSGGLISHKVIVEKNLLLIYIANALMYTGAWLAMSLGVSVENVSIVAPVSSVYPAITVLLAMIVLKEKLVLNQKIGVLTILAGIILISI